LKIGKIDFLNTLPFFYSLTDPRDAADFEFFPGTPAEINEKLRKNEIDAGIASSLFCAMSPGEYVVLPELCIAADRKVGSVLLYSTCPLEQLDGKTIALSSKSLSAASLLKILFSRRWNFSCSYESSPLPPEEMIRDYPACLAIGDEALFFRRRTEFVYDVGELWREWTHLPFCFAVWTVRKSFAEKNPSRVRDFQKRLSAVLRLNLKRLDALVRPGDFLSEDEKALAAGYLAGLRYFMTEDVREGLKLFFEYARTAGLISAPPELEFFETSAGGIKKGCFV